MHSSNTFITRLGLHNNVVLVWRDFDVSWLPWIVTAAGPTKHRNPRKQFKTCN